MNPPVARRVARRQPLLPDGPLLPMLASSGELPRRSEGWAFEVKWDGVRALSCWRRGRLRIEGRKGNDITARYPELHPLGRALGTHEAILDGEIVAFDEQGVPSFERLQRRMHQTSESLIARLQGEVPVTYMIFDLLYLDGRLTTSLPYRERRELLEGLALDGPAWSVPAPHLGSGRDFLQVTAAHGLEGVLAKRLDSRYLPGQRSSSWLKIKNSRRQELVVGGWLPGKGQRSGQLGALLVGYHEGRGRKRALRYAGRVGSGFDERELQRLGRELAARERPSSPFGGEGEQPPRGARFIEPELVAEVRFSHWTRGRILRHPVYLGLREDKPARAVELELPAREGRDAEGRDGEGRDAEGRDAEGRDAEGRDGEAGVARDGGGDERRDGKEGPREAVPYATPPYEVLRETRRYAEVRVGGRTLRLSNRDKVLYPQSGFTKGQLIDFYTTISPLLVPHLAGRPLTLKRYPDGVEGEHFYEKRCPAHRPEWVRTAAIWSERQEEPIDYCLVGDLPTLAWVANLATIELHPSLSLARAIDSPTSLVFDLDPGPPAGLRECAKVALHIRELFGAFSLTTLVKTSGAKGLQVYLPLNTPVRYAQTKPFARAVAELLVHEHPKQVVARMTKSLRPGKVLVDWSQNDAKKTTVSVYSLRAQPQPTISTPLAWEEVERTARRRTEPQLSAEPRALLKRLDRDGDLFAPLLELQQRLPVLGGAATEAGGSRKAHLDS